MVYLVEQDPLVPREPKEFQDQQSIRELLEFRDQLDLKASMVSRVS